MSRRLESFLTLKVYKSHLKQELINWNKNRFESIYSCQQEISLFITVEWKRRRHWCGFVHHFDFLSVSRGGSCRNGLFGEYDGWCRLWYSSSFNFYSVSWATCGWTLSWWRFCPFLSDGRLLCSSSSTIISASWVKHIVGPNRFGHLLALLEVEQENCEINGKMISNKNEIHVYIERNMWFKTSHQHIKKLTGYL